MNCEALKRRLSTQDAGDLMIRARIRGMMLHITRQMFEEMIEGIVHRAMIRVDRVLSDANMTAAQLDRILLVGGSTRIPYIREQLTAHLQHEICADIVNPDEAVALGAAYYAQMLVSGNALAEASAMQQETQAAPETPEEPAAPTPVLEEREERPADDRRLGLDGGKEPERRWGMQGNVVREEVVIPDFTDVTAHGYGVKAYLSVRIPLLWRTFRPSFMLFLCHAKTTMSRYVTNFQESLLLKMPTNEMTQPLNAIIGVAIFSVNFPLQRKESHFTATLRISFQQ